MNQTRSPSHPLVSFAVFGYNQEKYIREAIEGAFDQTYEPLEIILSDDCSSDRTFAIMQEMASAYAGPHRVILLKSSANLGFGSHINNVVRHCEGDWIVVAAGDDISLPNRVESVVGFLDADHEETSLIHSASIKITEEGREISAEQSQWLSELNNLREMVRKKAYILGATAAWHRRLFSDYEALPENLMYEDQVLQTRAVLTGKIGYISQPLVKHRVGGVTSTYKGLSLHDKIFGISNDRWLVARGQQIRDVKEKGGDPEVFLLLESDYKDLQFRSNLRKSPSCINKMKLTAIHMADAGKYVDTTRYLALSIFPRLTERLFNFQRKRRQKP